MEVIVTEHALSYFNQLKLDHRTIRIRAVDTYE